MSSSQSQSRSNEYNRKQTSDQNKNQNSSKRSKHVTPQKTNLDEATDLSESDEGENDLRLIPNVGPHKTNLETYFRHNYDFGKIYNRFIQDMVTICDNQGNDISFIGMCKTIPKLQKVNNALREQLLSMKNNREVANNRHMAKVNDLKQFLKVKVVNLFWYKFIMVS